MYLISLAMEDKIPYLGITISSFVAIHPYLTKLCYNIGELTRTRTRTRTRTHTHIQGDYSNPTHGGEIKFNLLGLVSSIECPIQL